MQEEADGDLYQLLVALKNSWQKKNCPPHFWLARSFQNEHQHNDAWKYANHNNIAIEPQLILCYEDFKDHHLPDIHNKGITGKEKCKDSNEKWK